MSEIEKKDSAHTGHTGHRQRLKKRFLRTPKYIEDYELLELLLMYALPRQDTKPLAKALLAHFGTLRRVLEARREELENVPGFGVGLWTFWLVLRECAARQAVAPLLEQECIATPEIMARIAQKRLVGSSHEACWLALMDAGGRCFAWECLKEGDLSSVAITPRDIITHACARNAHAFFLVHNHPGGNASASRADIILTAQIAELAPRMQLHFIEHIIVTERECYAVLLKQYV